MNIEDYSKLRTLNGYSPQQVLAEMQKPLEANAYKKVQGAGANLTDIKSPYLVETLTRLFGMYGIGWMTRHGPITVDKYNTVTSSGKDRLVYDAQVMDFELVLVWDNGGVAASTTIDSTGGSDNDVQEYAIRGALTNALGAAAARMLWQLHIYKNQTAPTSKDEKQSEQPNPWWLKAYDYAMKHAEVYGTAEKPLMLKDSDFGRKTIVKLHEEMIGKGQAYWFQSSTNMDAAIKKYTGKAEQTMDWRDFRRLSRYYAGPFILPGETVGDCLYQHACAVNTWQAILKSVPLEEGFVVNQAQANILNEALYGMADWNPSEQPSTGDWVANVSSAIRARIAATAEAQDDKEEA